MVPIALAGVTAVLLIAQPAESIAAEERASDVRLEAELVDSGPDGLRVRGRDRTEQLIPRSQLGAYRVRKGNFELRLTDGRVFVFRIDTEASKGLSEDDAWHTIPPASETKRAAPKQQGSRRSPVVLERPPSDAIPAHVRRMITEEAETDHPGDYALQERVIANEIAAYKAIQNMKPPDGVAGSHFFRIKQVAERDHARDYSTQLWVIRQEVAAYLALRTYTGVSGFPSDVLQRIKDKAQTDHPDNYRTQLYVIKREIDSYKRLKR